MLKRWRVFANLETRGNLSQWIREKCSDYINRVEYQQEDSGKWLEEYIEINKER